MLTEILRQHTASSRYGVGVCRSCGITDRGRCRSLEGKFASYARSSLTQIFLECAQENLDQETAEQMEGVGGQEQKRARAYVVERCGPA
jgi:hypothetical protein